MNENLGMPTGQVQDIPLSEEDGLKQGRIDPIRVEEIQNALPPGLNFLSVVGCNLVLSFRRLRADAIEITQDSSYNS